MTYIVSIKLAPKNIGEHLKHFQVMLHVGQMGDNLKCPDVLANICSQQQDTADDLEIKEPGYQLLWYWFNYWA